MHGLVCDCRLSYRARNVGCVLGPAGCNHIDVHRGPLFWARCVCRQAGRKNGLLSGWVSVSQAVAAWQWFNHLASKVPADRSLLRINIDETSVCLFQDTGKGTVFNCKKRWAPDPEPTQPASRKRRRTCLTHVAIICDNPRLQPLLPQYIIGNCNTFLRKDWSGLLAGAPGNVVLVRQQSAWNNIKLFVQILERLGTILRPYLISYQPVVFFDACRVHCASVIFQACLRCQLWVVLVPARLTWLLHSAVPGAVRDRGARSKQPSRQRLARGRPLTEG